MKLLVGGTILAGLLLMLSCNPASKFEAELSEIDSCLIVIDDAETQLNAIDFDSLQLMVDHVLANEEEIKIYYHPDTLSLEIGTRMNECKGVRKTLKNLDAKRNNFKNEIGALKVQFTNLKSDIEDGVLTAEKIKDFLATEKEDLNQLNLSLNGFYSVQELQKKYYYSAVPVIDALIVKLKNEATQE